MFPGIPWRLVTASLLLLAMLSVSSAQGREAQLAEAKRLNEEAVALNRAGRYKDAIVLTQKALTIRESVLGPNDPEVATALNNLGELYNAQGDRLNAEPLFTRALAIREKVLGSEHPDVAASLSSLAGLYYAKGDYPKAEEYFTRALAIDEKALGPENPNVASDLNNLAELYKTKGDYERAEPLFLRALAIDEKSLGTEDPNIEGVAGDLNNLAGLYYAQGDYAKAEPMYRRVADLLPKAFGPEHPYLAATLNNLAELYRVTADYVRAESLYLRAIEILERAYGKEHHDVATAHNNLGLLYRAKGDYARAEEQYSKALDLRQKALPTDHPDLGQSLNNLAEVYKKQGQYDRALPLYVRALAIREKALGADHPDVAQTLNNLAEAHREKGEYALAEPLYLRASKILEKKFGPGHSWRATTLNNLGLLYRAKHDYVNAENMHKQAFTILDKALGPNHPLVAEALNNLAALYEVKGDDAQAVQFLRHGQEVRENNLKLILTAGSENQKQLFLNMLSSETAASISLHVRSAPTNPEAIELALTTILRRKGRSLDAMSDQIATLRRHAAPEDKTSLDQLMVIRARIANLQVFGGSDGYSRRGREQIASLESAAERLEGEISRRSSQFRAVEQPITLTALRNAIPPGAALVEISAYQPLDQQLRKQNKNVPGVHYVAYVVLHDKRVPQWVELGDSASIDRVVEQFRLALKDPNRSDVKSIARQLDQTLMRPIRRLLGTSRHIFLAPDGTLNLIPFEALVNEQGKYLVEDYVLTYLTSGRDLLRLSNDRRTGTPPVVIANPLYDLSQKSQAAGSGGEAKKLETTRRSADFLAASYKPLPGTAEEASVLMKLLGEETKVLLEEAATEAALKNVAGPRILHVATHGFFLTDQTPTVSSQSGRETLDSLAVPLPEGWENPLLRSGLVLAGVKQGQSGIGEDGVLTAMEAAALNLWGTKLVVLSACETGLGDVRNGEGVYGLRRALVLAGSETQVMSLWKVSDAGTRDLMTAYYTRLRKGEGRAEALRQVQLAMLRGEMKPRDWKSSRTRETRDISGAVPRDYRHPYFWAAFIQSGDWRSLDDK